MTTPLTRYERMDAAETDPVDHNPAGFPRPVIPMDGKNTPMQWVAGNLPTHGEWGATDRKRASKATYARLCLVCGEPRGNDYVYALANGIPLQAATGTFESILMDEAHVGPSPTWGHPRCILIAATFCPHLKEAQYPACTPNGVRLTHDALRDLVRDLKNT